MGSGGTGGVPSDVEALAPTAPVAAAACRSPARAAICRRLPRCQRAREHAPRARPGGMRRRRGRGAHQQAEALARARPQPHPGDGDGGGLPRAAGVSFAHAIKEQL